VEEESFDMIGNNGTSFAYLFACLFACLQLLHMVRNEPVVVVIVVVAVGI